MLIVSKSIWDMKMQLIHTNKVGWCPSMSAHDTQINAFVVYMVVLWLFVIALKCTNLLVRRIVVNEMGLQRYMKFQVFR